MKPNKREVQHDLTRTLNTLYVVMKHFKAYGGPQATLDEVETQIRELEEKYNIKPRR